MANTNTKAHVLVRDGFVCKICGCRLVLAQAVKLLDIHVPGQQLYDPHGKLEPLRSRWATIDHKTPEARGGMDTFDNLEACCVSCNSRKGCGGPCERKPVFQSGVWDGLSSLFVALAELYPQALSADDRKWLEALKYKGIQPDLHHAGSIAAMLRAEQDKVLAALDSWK